MRVKVVPDRDVAHDGVSRYVMSLKQALPHAAVTLVDGAEYDVLHLVEAHRYDPEWREAKRRGKKLVVTVHDLIPEHFGLRGAQYAGVAERREVLSAADAVIAVSQYTKDDVVATYGIPAAKIHVIHNGVDHRHSPSSAPSPSPYLLWVGRRAGYKNFFWFVRAVAPLLWRTSWRVVCTGGQAFGRKERLLIGLLGLSRRFEVINADELTISQLYREAICLVMPSKAEGFGLPLIEAMALGCPVVIPYAHVFPEIAGDAASYYEMGDAKGFRRRVEKCAETDVRSELIEKGRLRAMRYTWKKCAEEVRKVYEEAGLSL